MKMLLMSENLGETFMFTLVRSAPLCVSVFGSSYEEACVFHGKVVEFFKEIQGRKRMSVDSCGDSTVFVSKVYDDCAHFDVCVFGNYFPIMIDLKEWSKSGIPGARFDYLFAEYGASVNSVDSFSVKFKSGYKLMDVLNRCCNWMYEHSSSPLSPEDFYMETMDSFLQDVGVAREDIFEEESWKNPEVDVPAATMMACFMNVLRNSIIGWELDGVDTLHLSISCTYAEETYSRDNVKLLISMFDDALCSEEKIWWQNIFDVFDDEITNPEG